MEFRALEIEGAFEVTSASSPTSGVFLESFRGDKLAEHLGHRLDVVQTNVSVSSREDGAGIHFRTSRPRRRSTSPPCPGR